MPELDVSYKACILKDIGQIKLVDKYIRPLNPNEVVVKIKSCGICASDIYRVFYKGPFAPDIVLGHEFSGVIVKTQNLTNHMLNSRVVVNPLIPCGKCTYCLQEKYNLCNNYVYLGVRRDGGFAEYSIVPKDNVISIPDSISYDEAALLEPFSVVYRGIKKITNLSHGSVLILGLGTIGLLSGMVVKRLGADRVIGIDRNAYKREIAQKFGFSNAYCADSFSSTTPFSALIDCSGSSDLLNQTIPTVEKQGTILLLGSHRNSLVFSSEVIGTIIRNELRIFSSWSSNFGKTDDDWAGSIRELSSRNYNLKGLISHRYPLNKIDSVFYDIHNKQIRSVKVIINPG